MNIDDSSSTPNVHLPNVPLVKKKNYDVDRKFKDLRLQNCHGQNSVWDQMATYTLSSVEFALTWKERIKSLLVSGILFVSMHVGKKLRKTLEIM
jgi:hypothetical protein